MKKANLNYKLLSIIWNEDCLLVILILLSCNLHDNQIYLQLSTNSHRVWLQVMSVARLNIFFNCSNWWWNFIIPEAFSFLSMSFWINILYKYVSEILCFSETLSPVSYVLPLYYAKGRGLLFCPDKGPYLCPSLHKEICRYLAHVTRPHDWKISVLAEK